MKITQIEVVNGLFNAKIEGATAFEISALSGGVTTAVGSYTTPANTGDSVLDKKAKAREYNKRYYAKLMLKKQKKQRVKSATKLKNLTCQLASCGRGFRGKEGGKYCCPSHSATAAHQRGVFAGMYEKRKVEGWSPWKSKQAAAEVVKQ